MSTHIFNKKQKLAFLIFVTCGMTITLLGLSPFNSIFITKNFEENNNIDSDDRDQLPRTMDYQIYEGTGKNLNLRLHQSLVNTTTKQFNNLDNANIFTEPFPEFPGYNSSFINMSINNIYAPDKTIVVETGTSNFNSIAFTDWAFSFEVRGNGILDNFSMCFTENHPFVRNATIDVYLYDAIWDSSAQAMKPDSYLADLALSYQIDDGSSAVWYNFTNINQNLNVANTDNNTFFLFFHQNTINTQANVRFHYENDGGTDDSKAWEDLGGGSWVLNGYDPSLVIFLTPLSNTPLPSQISLKVNGSDVSDITNQQGYWSSMTEYDSSSDLLTFDLTAEWWDVSCDVTRVQINYTKADLSATSSFTILNSGDNVIWNVTISGGLNYFDRRITTFNTINFTIPRIWHDASIKVFNGTTEKTIFKRLINSEFREIQVFNAGNGTFWHLTANSSNLILSLDSYVNDVTLSVVNYSDILELNTTFTELVSTGSLNLSVFSPVPHYLNHTTITPISSPDNEFQANWDISNDAKTYGIFKIQASWNNDTAAGFLEDYVTIIADTKIVLSVPSLVYDSGESFDLSVFYNDTGQDLGITADTISYEIDNKGIRTDNITPLGGGYYNITLIANDTDFSYGPNVIEVNTNKTYYNNQTDSVTITILAETDANILYPSPSAVFDSGDTFDLAIHYNDTVKNIGIAGATIEYSLDGGSTYRTDNIVYIISGQYNITISASDSDFNGYGSKSIIVNITRQYYYGHSESVTIDLLGETSPLSPVRVPNQAYYTAAETFNISLYYEDSAKGIGISVATITVDVGGTVYNPTALTDYGDGNYDMTINCSDSIFSSYGTFPIRVNVSKATYYSQTYTLNTLIVGNESLTVLAPNSGAVYIEGQSFDIAVEYNDTILGTGIIGATIEYSLDGGSTYRQDNVVYIGSGQYNITIDVNDTDFMSYGFVDIYIDASIQFYENRSTTYNFHRQITTQITPFDVYDLDSVMKGLNVSYTFNYSDTTGKPIQDASWSRLSSYVGFTAFLENLGNGNFTLHLDTTNVDTGSDYVYEFNIYATGNETQIIRLTIDVLIIQTEVTDIAFIDEIDRYSGNNQSVRFYFNDTTNNLPVLNLLTSNIIVKNNATGTPFNNGEFWLFDPYSNGTYILDITLGTRNSGFYTLEINASKFPDYDLTIFYVVFYYRGNDTDINLISLSYFGGPPIPEDSTGFHNYTMFEGSDLTIEFNITDSEFDDNLITGDADLYTVRYTNLGTGANGVLTVNLYFLTSLHTGRIFTSNPALTVGRYLLNLTTSRTNYEDAWFTFNLTILSKYQTNLTLVFVTTQINTGDELTIIFKAEYYNGIEWMPIIGGSIKFIPSTGQNQTAYTNSTGEVEFTMIIGSNVRAINITIELIEKYNYLSDTYFIPDSLISVILPTPPLGFEDFLPYIIIIGAALAVVVAAVATYRGVVVPKKKEKQRILTEVKTIFDDAINLEHILVLYKGTGTCIFFKSYGSEQIDPELIGGFLSAVSSFGKEMATQAALNEISYGDKMLLLADGYLIRVALVLGKNASLILRRHLKDFIESFEKTYKDILPNWRGQLNHFKNAGLIVDDLLNTSIILPHQISYDFASVKDLKNPHSKEVLKVAQSCCEEAEREFFFIATLLKDASEMTSKDTAEIFMGIKELRDKKLLIPIEISAIEAQPISQQELNLINQKVTTITNLTSVEKQKLAQDLAQLGPVEREAYLTSLTKQAEIVTAPIKTTVEGLDVDNKKSAKKGIKELLKRGKIAQGKKDYIKAVDLYEGAAILASNWELHDDFVKIEETIRKTKIEDLLEKKTKLEKEAKAAVKTKAYAEAAAKYKYASRMASEIFKLGDTSMTKEVKRLTNKSNEYEKLK